MTLRAPYPNPTNYEAIIHYALPDVQEADLQMYDILGRRIRTLAHGEQVGRHTVRLDATDLASGTYFLRLAADDATLTRRVTVMR